MTGTRRQSEIGICLVLAASSMLLGPVAGVSAQAIEGDEPALGVPLDASGLPIVPEARGGDVDPVEGDPVELVFVERPPMQGVFLRRGIGTLTVRIDGVETTWPESSIQRLIVLIPPAERAAMMRGYIDDRDLARRVVLAEWMRAQGLFDEAAAELRGVLAEDASYPRAARLLEVVESLIAARDAMRARPVPEEARPAAPRAPDAPRVEYLPPRALTPDEVNLLRVYEIDLASPPPLKIDRDTIERLLDTYQGSPFIPSTRVGREEFLRLPEWKILDIMFRLRARELYGSVRVGGDPETFTRFRDDVQTRWLVNACATNRCHGGAAAGRLRLINERAGGTEAVYTNFLILNRFVMSDGRTLISENDPEASPLLEMGLPRDDAGRGHPDVRGWRPVFRNRFDRGYRAAVAWINSLYRPRPEYPIEYDPSGEPGAGDETNVPSAP